MDNILNNTNEALEIIKSRDKFAYEIDASSCYAQKIRKFLIGTIHEMESDARYLEFCKSSIRICEDLSDLVYKLIYILPEECSDIGVDIDKFEFPETKKARMSVDFSKTKSILYIMRDWVNNIGLHLNYAKEVYPQTKVDNENIIEIFNEMYSKIDQLKTLLEEYNAALKELEDMLNNMNMQFNF